MRAKEKRLINKIKAGDDQALKELFLLYKPLVNSVLKNIICIIMIMMIGSKRL